MSTAGTEISHFIQIKYTAAPKSGSTNGSYQAVMIPVTTISAVAIFERAVPVWSPYRKVREA
jgi:hypothetical protein